MANVQQTQAFYALTLEQPSAPSAAVLCNVIPGLKAGDQQIFEARGQHILLHRITENADRTERKVTTVCDQDVFGIVRGVAAFRIPGTSTGKILFTSTARTPSDVLRLQRLDRYLRGCVGVSGHSQSSTMFVCHDIDSALQINSSSPQTLAE